MLAGRFGFPGLGVVFFIEWGQLDTDDATFRFGGFDDFVKVFF